MTNYQILRRLARYYDEQRNVITCMLAAMDFFEMGEETESWLWLFEWEEARDARDKFWKKFQDHQNLIAALRERLAQPEQEPVAWLVQYSNKHEFVWGQKPQWIADAIGIEPLYTAPQRREWVGLTKEEAKEISMANRPYVVDMIAALEARLKEKNK